MRVYIYRVEFVANFERKKMGRSHSRSPKLSLSRSVGRVRVCSPSLQRKRASNSIKTDQKVEFLGDGEEIDYGGSYEEENGGTGNKVMVVVDSSLDAKGALEWALSHTVQNRDTILLLYIKQGQLVSFSSVFFPKSSENYVIHFEYTNEFIFDTCVRRF